MVLAHPLGGPFNMPPAGGAFPQPLPNLPGIPTDGGLHTVDLGNHQFNRDNSNGFMFAAGPSRRYVASIESDGIESVSSLPGGQSGVPSSPFYAQPVTPLVDERNLPAAHRRAGRTPMTGMMTMRLLDVPVPSVYGPTADENPFAGA